MSTFFERGPRRQRGNILLEGLICTVLTGIIGAGTAHIAARIAVGQHELRAEGISVAQMRQLLNVNGEALCGTTGNAVTLPGGQSASLNVTCTAAPAITVTPGITAAAPTPASVTVTGVRVVSASMPLTNLGVDPGSGAAQMIVSTQQ